MSSAEAYTKEVHDQLKRYATWLPTDKMTVGTVGYLNGALFYPITHIDNLGITAKVVRDPDAKASYKFASTGVKEMAVNASASGTPGSPAAGTTASLEIGFSKENSVYMLLENCVGSSIENLVDLGSQVLDKLKDDEWKIDYAVVTRVVNAGSATIFQAQSKGASAVLEADNSTSSVAEVIKAGGKIKLRSQSSVGVTVVAENKLTPLMSLARIKYSWYDLLQLHPSFNPDLFSGHSISRKKLDFHLTTIPHFDFSEVSRSKNDLQLNIRLPKYGKLVDVSQIINLADKATGSRPTSGKFNTATSLPLASRITEKKLRSAVSLSPCVDFKKRSSATDFVHLSVSLPKNGSDVSIEPLLTFALKAAQPKASASGSAELSFDELP